MKNISITIPMDYDALCRASDMLRGLAADILTTAPSDTPAANDTPAKEDPFDELLGGASDIAIEAAEVFGDSKLAISAVAMATPVLDVTEPAPACVNLAPGSIDPTKLIPWDHRIHSSGKAKLAKKPNCWKMKRGVDAALIAQVEAELIVAMTAGPANPVVTNAEEKPAPAPALLGGTGAGGGGIPPLTTGTSTITTFPALMAAITANAIPEPAVTAAVNIQGLQALPLLAARPDLIPAVAAALGV